MRLLLIFLTAIFAAILIGTLPSCDKKDENITSPDDEEQFLCGDANGDSAINTLDVARLIRYLYKGGSAPNLVTADIDGIHGLTINDLYFLLNYIYNGGNDPICLSVANDTILPVSLDTIFINSGVVSPGESVCRIDITIKTHNAVQVFTLPLKYYLAGSNLMCDSILLPRSGESLKSVFPESFLYDIETAVALDTVNNKTLITGGPIPANDSVTFASLWFTLTPSVDTQTIVIDTTTYPPSHIVIFSRYESPNTIAFIPEIIF